MKLIQVPFKQWRQGLGPGHPQPSSLCHAGRCRGIGWARGDDDAATGVPLGQSDDRRTERVFGPAPEFVSRTDVHDDQAMSVANAGGFQALANATSGGCIVGHLHRIVLGRAGANAQRRKQIPLIEDRVTRKEIGRSLDAMRVDRRPQWHVIADAHGRAAGPRQPCRAWATVQIDRDVEPFATQSPCERNVVQHPSGASATRGDDHVVEMWIAANNRGR